MNLGAQDGYLTFPSHLKCSRLFTESVFHILIFKDDTSSTKKNGYIKLRLTLTLIVVKTKLQTACAII